MSSSGTCREVDSFINEYHYLPLRVDANQAQADSGWLCADDASCAPGFYCFLDEIETYYGEALNGYCFPYENTIGMCQFNPEFEYYGCPDGQYCDPLNGFLGDDRLITVGKCMEGCAPEGMYCNGPYGNPADICCPGLVCGGQQTCVPE